MKKIQSGETWVQIANVRLPKNVLTINAGNDNITIATTSGMTIVKDEPWTNFVDNTNAPYVSKDALVTDFTTAAYI